MALKINSNEVANARFNGVDVSEIKFNGTTV